MSHSVCLVIGPKRSAERFHGVLPVAVIERNEIGLDGEWYEKGHMGWWGVVSDEKDERDWDEEWGKLVNSVDDDTLLIVVDIHI